MTLESTIAGTWYPGTERSIRAFADKCEAAAGNDAASATKVPNILILPQKAGLSSDAWREGAKFETFQAEVFHE